MTSLKYYRDYYEQDGIRSADISAEERISMVLNIFPQEVHSVLDVGCGDGTLISLLGTKYSKAGLDISYNALQRAKDIQRVQASVGAIPLLKNSFDLVLCTEVIEHLGRNEYESTVKEIQRIARRYIIVSVPYLEDLASKETRCPNCKYIYHIHLHLRDFNLDLLSKLFTNFSLKTFQYSLVHEKSFPGWALKLRRKFGGRYEWDKNLLCPRCGQKNHDPPQRSLISVTTGLMAECFGKKTPKWIACLYEKR